MGMDIPIWRDSSRLLVLIEEAVKRFPRYHKYTLGSDLRRQAMNVHRLLVRALNAKGPERQRQVERLNLAVDDLKLMIQLGKEIQAFQSFRQFEEIAGLAVYRFDGDAELFAAQFGLRPVAEPPWGFRQALALPRRGWGAWRQRLRRLGLPYLWVAEEGRRRPALRRRVLRHMFLDASTLNGFSRPGRGEPTPFNHPSNPPQETLP